MTRSSLSFKYGYDFTLSMGVPSCAHENEWNKLAPSNELGYWDLPQGNLAGPCEIDVNKV